MNNELTHDEIADLARCHYTRCQGLARMLYYFQAMTVEAGDL